MCVRCTNASHVEYKDVPRDVQLEAMRVEASIDLTNRAILEREWHRLEDRYKCTVTYFTSPDSLETDDLVIMVYDDNAPVAESSEVPNND